MREKTDINSSAVSENRHLYYVDIAKIFAMILLLINHVGLWRGWDGNVGGYWQIKIWICSFHMELFFFLHGVTSRKEIGSFKSFLSYIAELIPRIVVPYVVWSMIYSRSLGIRFWAFIAYGSNPSTGAVSNGVLWFLPVFAVSSVITAVIKFINRQTKYEYAAIAGEIILFTIFFSVIRHSVPGIGLPFGFQTVLIAVPMMLVGQIFRNILYRFCGFSVTVKLILGTGLCILGGFLAQAGAPETYGVVITALADIGCVWIYYPVALISIIGILLIAMTLEKFLYLARMGQGTLIYMAGHYIWLEMATEVLSKLNVSVSWPVELIYYTVVTFVLYVFSFLLCMKYIPELNGKRGY